MKLWYISISVGNQLSLNNWSSEIIGLTYNDRSSVIITKWRNLLVQISLIFHQGASQRKASFWVFWLRATFINDNHFVMQQRLAFSRQSDSWKGQEMKSGGKKAKGKKGRGREELKPSLSPPPLLKNVSFNTFICQQYIFFYFPMIIDFTVCIILINAFLQVFDQWLNLINGWYITCIYPLTYLFVKEQSIES